MALKTCLLAVYAGKLSADIRPLPLLSNKITIKHVTLNDAIANFLTGPISGNLMLTDVLNSTNNSGVEPETKETTNNPEVETDSESACKFSLIKLKMSNLREQPAIGSDA